VNSSRLTSQLSERVKQNPCHSFLDAGQFNLCNIQFQVQLSPVRSRLKSGPGILFVYTMIIVSSGDEIRIVINGELPLLDVQCTMKSADFKSKSVA